MKIIAIISSPRGKNSNTLKLVNAALDGVSAAGAEAEIVDVAKLKIKYCTACNVCHTTGVCPIKDTYNEVLEKLLSADGIIWSSPNYMTNVTAQLKTLFDRSPRVTHEQLFDGKYGFSLTTAGSRDVNFVLDVMNGFMKMCGGKFTGGVGCTMAQGPLGMEAAIGKSYEMGRDLVEAIREKRQYPEQEALHHAWREGFRHVIIANKEEWPHNVDHWITKGWL
ncbi:MAG: Iron-sulfur flavoprotein [Methanomethylovorans sp. PtaU1.Bin093]|jgi:multimeric flavodoxin WrbA|uniref:flavodoxin family protein n=3 Tax=Methanomethylovorans TaxID=101191 RepID=UPI0009D47405|nr:flavodoxin family protein [Methanomethylovorans sp. PtaU1.Bin093]OPY22091.1 MAG: Iron-sulfur flavoprotein [Methanomethylovorans sp. PtaU1.Bin093]